MLTFSILKESKKSNARLGLLETAHGVVETPVLVPVATQGVVKTLTSEEVEAAKCQLLICNTYHLHLRPGEKIVKKNGGLHTFMNWKRPIMTDSGGFQVFSLGFGKEYGMGKVLKKPSDVLITAKKQPTELTITEEGVIFRSHIDGSELFLNPEESMRVQAALGADIIFTFDECPPPVADYAYMKKSVERTHRWAKRSLAARSPKQALYGIVQGGAFRDLREKSARFMARLPFEGFGIGGEFGTNKQVMARMLRWTFEYLPQKKPRHLLGIGHPEDIVPIIKAGVDTFDCIAPTHYARRGIAFTSEGTVHLSKSVFLQDKGPIDKACSCFVCGAYTRAYITHLLRAKEITPMRLLTFHNLFFFNSYIEEIREKIKEGTL